MITKLRTFLKRLGKQRIAGALAAVFLLTLATCSQVPYLNAQTASGSLPSLYIPNPSSVQISGLNSVATFGGIGGYTTCVATITGTWSGTLTFEQVQQDQSTWVTVKGEDYAGANSGTTSSSNVTWVFPCAGSLQWRARFSSYSSGTANIAFIASIGNAVAAGGGGGGGGTQNVAIVSPNPLNVNVSNPAPSGAPPTAGASPPASFPYNMSLTACEAIPTPTPAAGQWVVDQCNLYGHKIVGIEPNTTITLTNTPAPAPTNTSGIPEVDPCTANPAGCITPAPLVQAVPSPTTFPQATSNPTLAHVLISNGTNWVQALVGGTAPGTYLGINICGLNSQNCAPISDNNANLAVNNVLGTYSTEYSWDGSAWAQARQDPQNGATAGAGDLWVTEGGGFATPFPGATTGPTVIKATPGRLVSLIIGGAGTGAITCYDSATTTSGTVLGITPATTTQGTVYTFNTIATKGITCSFPTGVPAGTISWY